MLNYGLTIALTIVQLVAWFLILFVWLPQKLFPVRSSRAWTYHLFDYVVRMAFASIIIVHLLAFLNIFDLLSLLFAFGLLYVGYRVWVRQEPLWAKMKDWSRTMTIAFFDLLDQQTVLKSYVTTTLTRTRRDFIAALPKGNDLWWALALGVVLLISGYLRLYEVVRGPALASADTYLHLFWFKGLGISRLYPDGLYPYGSYALLQVINQFTLIDGTLLMRLLPGVIGVLLVVTIYWSVHRLTARRSPALLAAALYGIFAFARWLPLPLPPQGDVLTVEMALIFLLPTFVFLTEALAETIRGSHRPDGGSAKETVASAPEPDEASLPRPSPAGLYFQGMACLFFIQPFVGILALIASVVALTLVTILSLRSRRTIRLLNLGLAGALVGLAPLLIGLAQGQSLHLGPLRWDVHFFGLSIRHINYLPTPPPTPAATPILYLGLAGALGLIALSVWRTQAGPTLRLGWQLFGAALLTLTLLFLPRRLGLNEILLAGQVARALAPVLSVLVGLCLHQLWLWLATLMIRAEDKMARPWPQYLELSLTISILIIILLPFPAVLIPSPTLAVTTIPKAEYDSVTAQIFRIKEELPTYRWTVVAYPEALPQVFGEGFSISNEDFLESYQPETWQFDPRRPELAIPSPHVFIFIEKQPYIVPGTSREEAIDRDLTRQRLQDWVERYQALHTDMSLYYEDGVLAVYHIYRTPEEEDRILTAIEAGQMPIGIAPPAPLAETADEPPVASGEPAAEDAPPTPTLVPTQAITYQVQRGEVINLVEFEGQIAPVDQERLFFRTSGRISSTYVTQGEVVTKGQLLAELDTSSLKRSLASARLDLELADTGSGSGLSQTAETRRAHLELEIAQLNLEASRAQANSGTSPSETAPVLEQAFLNLQAAEDDFNGVQEALDTPVGENEALKSVWNDGWVSTVFERGSALEEATKNYLLDELYYEQAQQALAQHEYDVAIAQRRVEMAQLRVDEGAAGGGQRLETALERTEADLKRIEADLAKARQAVENGSQNPDVLAGQYERLRELERQQAETELEIKRLRAELATNVGGQSAEAQQAEIDLLVAMIELEQIREQKADLELNALQAKASLDRSVGVRLKAESKYNDVANDRAQPPELLALHQAQMAYIEADVAHQRAGSGVSEKEVMLREHDVKQAQLNAGVTGDDAPVFDLEREWALLEIEQLEKEIANAQLIAPGDGDLLSISLAPGQFVDAFQPVAIMADLSRLEVSADQVPLQIRRALTATMPVTITTLVGTEQTPIRGTVRSVPLLTASPPDRDAGEGSPSPTESQVRVTLADGGERPGYQLGDRVLVRAEAARQADTLWLPPQAILTSPDGEPYVFLKVGNREDRVAVVLGLESRERVEIVSGLEEGQTVILK